MAAAMEAATKAKAEADAKAAEEARKAALWSFKPHMSALENMLDWIDWKTINVPGASTRDLFHAWDIDRNGKVSRKEFMQALPALGFDLKQSAMDDLWDFLDDDGSDELVLSELDKKLRRVRQRSPSPGAPGSPGGGKGAVPIQRSAGFKETLKLLRTHADKVRENRGGGLAGLWTALAVT